MQEVNINVPEKLNRLAHSLPKPLYIVGGVCRDALANLKTVGLDWDICAPICADVVLEKAKSCGFNVTATYKNTGTVRMQANGEEYEFTTFRTDKYVRGQHVPTEVTFTDDINADARRRDFKCNAVYYDISARKFVDPLGGMEDIELRRVNTVVSAKKVFGEDGLRLMRLCRISAQTGFTPTKECLDGARANRLLIKDVACERVWAELNAILHADKKYGIGGAQYVGLKLLKESGVLEVILPELALGDKMEQRKDFHDYDVLEHSLRCVLYAPDSVRLSALLHDVGKPYCYNAFGKFIGHELHGAEIARDICARLRIPTATTARVCKLISMHMYDLSGEASENKVRKFIVNNYEYIDDLLLLKQADFSACKDNLGEAPCVTKWKKIIFKMQNEGVPFTVKGLAVRGDELIGAGILPDQTGKTLKFLLEQVAMGCVKNDKNILIAHALTKQRR